MSDLVLRPFIITDFYNPIPDAQAFAESVGGLLRHGQDEKQFQYYSVSLIGAPIYTTDDDEANVLGRRASELIAKGQTLGFKRVLTAVWLGDYVAEVIIDGELVRFGLSRYDIPTT